jgi:hypothetical protein
MSEVNDSPSNDSGSGPSHRVGFAASSSDREAALALLDGLGSAEAEASQEGASEAEETAAEEEAPKPRRVVKDIEPKEDEKPTSAAFKSLRRERRQLEAAKAESDQREARLKGLEQQLADRLERANLADQLEEELRSNPVAVLRKFGVDLDRVNQDYFKQADPQNEVKTLAQQIAELKQQLTERDEKATRAQREAAAKAELSAAVGQIRDYLPQVGEDYEAASFFADTDPELFGEIAEDAIGIVAKQGGPVMAENVLKLVDTYFVKRYEKLKPRLAASPSRTSPGASKTPQLEKAPRSLVRSRRLSVAKILRATKRGSGPPCASSD